MYSEFEDQYLNTQPFQVRQRDAWRHGRWACEAFEVPLTIVERLANPARLLEVQRDQPRLLRIERELIDRGLDEPLILVVDTFGRVALKDGHHRLTCVVRLDWPGPLPCRMVVSERLRSHGVPVHEVLIDMLT